MNLPDTLVGKLQRLPPCVARLFAKEGRRLMTDRELMRRTGWGRKRLISVYQRASWAKVKAEDIDTFLAACRLSWSSQRRQRWKLQAAIENGGMEAVARFHHLRPKTAFEAKNLKQHLKRIEKLLTP